MKKVSSSWHSVILLMKYILCLAQFSKLVYQLYLLLLLYCVGINLNENTNHCYPAFQLSRKQFRFNLKIIVQATFSIKTYFKDVFDCSRKAVGKIANVIVYLKNYSSDFDLDCRNFYGKRILQVAKRFLKNNEMLSQKLGFSMHLSDHYLILIAFLTVNFCSYF